MILGTLVAALALLAQLEATPTPDSSPAPERSSVPCASASGTQSIEGALATPVDQVPLLGSIARFATLEPSRQRTLFDSVVTLVRRRPNVQAAVLGFCVPAAAYAATERALLVVVRQWTIAERSDPVKLAQFATGLRTAMAMQTLGDAIPKSQRTPILAPFLDVDPSLFAVPPDPSEEDDLCLDGTRPARPRAAFHPAYPDVARRSNTMGTVDVGVELDRFGFATAMYVVSSSAPKTPAGQALEREALVAAALTKYDQACAGSDASSDVYVLRAEFGTPDSPVR